MAIKLKDMLKKAEDKGYSANPTKVEINKPWQQHSVFYKERAQETIHKNTHKSNTNRTQTEHKKRKDTQKGTQRIHKKEEKLYTEKDTNYTQKNRARKSKFYLKMKGHQKDILSFIYNNCKQNRDLISDPISKEEISISLDIKHLSIHNTIQRLVTKGLLTRKEAILGRGGSTIYEIPEFVYKEISETEIEKANREKVNTNLYTENHYSSSIYNKTTTRLPEEWLSIKFSSLIHIGFSETQLIQLYETGLCLPETIQESINYFSFDLEYNNLSGKYNNPLNVLMGIMRKGKLWSRPKNYESPQDRALRQLAEQRKKENEKRAKLIDDLIKTELPVWRENLSEKEIKEIVPKNILESNFKASITSYLKEYFKKDVLIPRLKKEKVLN